MSACLVALPDEVLVHAFGYIDADKHYVFPIRRTICALARTCRRLSAVAFGELYERIFFDIDGNDIVPSWEQVKCIKQFLRTCKKQPKYLQQMRVVKITWLLNDDEDKVLESLLGALALSKSLTQLRLDIDEVSYELGTNPCCLRPLLQHDREFVNLQVLELLTPSDDDLQAEFLYKLASLPSLETLSIRAPICEPEDNSFTTTPQRTRLGKLLGLKDEKFNLRQLELVGNICEEVFEVILPRCQGLEKLKFTPPGLSEDSEFAFGDSGDDDSELFSPGMISRLVVPLSETLKELSLSGKPDCYTNLDARSDGSVLRLSPLKHLKRLEIPERLLLWENPLFVEADVAQGMFPASLQELEIHFQCPTGLFWDSKSIPHLLPWDFISDSNRQKWLSEQRSFTALFEETLSSADSVSSHVDWYLSLLVLRKVNKNFLPRLRSMRVIELDAPGRRWEKFELTQCGFHSELFDDVGVDFNITLRTPMGWKWFRNTIFMADSQLLCTDM